jgi:hypothetical protein
MLRFSLDFISRIPHTSCTSWNLNLLQRKTIQMATLTHSLPTASPFRIPMDSTTLAARRGLDVLNYMEEITELKVIAATTLLKPRQVARLKKLTQMVDGCTDVLWAEINRTVEMKAIGDQEEANILARRKGQQ